MPEITIDPQKIIQPTDLLDLIWKIVKVINPEKANSIEWYAHDGIFDKIQELWELIK